VASSPSSNFQHSQPVEAAGRTQRESLVNCAGLRFAFFSLSFKIFLLPLDVSGRHTHISRPTISFPSQKYENMGSHLYLFILVNLIICVIGFIKDYDGCHLGGGGG
jgi:hypothetical protein